MMEKKNHGALPQGPATRDPGLRPQPAVQLRFLRYGSSRARNRFSALGPHGPDERSPPPDCAIKFGARTPSALFGRVHYKRGGPCQRFMRTRRRARLFPRVVDRQRHGDRCWQQTQSKTHRGKRDGRFTNIFIRIETKDKRRFEIFSI